MQAKANREAAAFCVTQNRLYWERVSQTLLSGCHSALRKNGEAIRRLLPTARNDKVLIPALGIWRR
jgi:predicted Zn-dependent protease